MAKILLADDDPITRAIINDVLSFAGHVVTEAVDGRDALYASTADTFDLVITDMLMPGMDGIELIGALRERQPGVRILAISSGGHFGSQDVLRWGRAVGADGVMAKPMKSDALRAVVDGLLAAPPGSGIEPQSEPEAGAGA